MTELEILENRADGNDPEAICELAWRYRQGDGVARDDAKAFKLFERAASIGDLVALNHLGLC